MILLYTLGTQGHPWQAWRHPDSHVERVTEFGFHIEQARTAERGGFDALFTVDSLAMFSDPAAPLYWALDPIGLLTAIAVHTQHIGLIATVGTTHGAPYSTARRLATLDHLSAGRAGWNVVTSASASESRNFSDEGPLDRDDRYRRAGEFLEACLQLWHAWDPDAVPADRAWASPVDTGRIHAVNYEGATLSVVGPLATPRSPQTVPVLCQAGPSPPARDLAARFADIVYAAWDDDETSRAYRLDLRRRARSAGRPADAVRLVPGVVPFLSSSESGARRFRREMEDLAGDLGAASRLHQVLAGTPEQVADRLGDAYRGGVLDGVSVGVPLVPGGLTDFVEEVVPILRQRGLRRRKYGPGTLRERLDLPVTQPVDRRRWSPFFTGSA